MDLNRRFSTGGGPCEGGSSEKGTLLTVLRINRRLEVMEPRLLRLGQAWCLLSVFVVCSVVPEAPWGLEASGGFDPCGFLIVKQECSRT